MYFLLLDFQERFYYTGHCKCIAQCEAICQFEIQFILHLYSHIFFLQSRKYDMVRLEICLRLIDVFMKFIFI